MALRAIPNLWCVRPADANETADALEGRARARATGRSALVLSRQKLPTLDRADVAPPSGVERGAYVLWRVAATAAGR